MSRVPHFSTRMPAQSSRILDTDDASEHDSVDDATEEDVEVTGLSERFDDENVSVADTPEFNEDTTTVLTVQAQDTNSLAIKRLLTPNNVHVQALSLLDDEYGAQQSHCDSDTPNAPTGDDTTFTPSGSDLATDPLPPVCEAQVPEAPAPPPPPKKKPGRPKKKRLTKAEERKRKSDLRDISEARRKKLLIATKTYTGSFPDDTDISDNEVEHHHPEEVSEANNQNNRTEIKSTYSYRRLDNGEWIIPSKILDHTDTHFLVQWDGLSALPESEKPPPTWEPRHFAPEEMCRSYMHSSHPQVQSFRETVGAYNKSLPLPNDAVFVHADREFLTGIPDPAPPKREIDWKYVNSHSRDIAIRLPKYGRDRYWLVHWEVAALRSEWVHEQPVFSSTLLPIPSVKDGEGLSVQGPKPFATTMVLPVDVYGVWMDGVVEYWYTGKYTVPEIPKREEMMDIDFDLIGIDFHFVMVLLGGALQDKGLTNYALQMLRECVNDLDGLARWKYLVDRTYEVFDGNPKLRWCEELRAISRIINAAILKYCEEWDAKDLCLDVARGRFELDFKGLVQEWMSYLGEEHVMEE